jgi:hypothetical protein
MEIPPDDDLLAPAVAANAAMDDPMTMLVRFENRRLNDDQPAEAISFFDHGKLFAHRVFYHLLHPTGILATTQQTVAASSTDLASVITLANSLRALVRAYSLAP